MKLDLVKRLWKKLLRHRMREIKMWSKLKKEFNDGSFNDKDVNEHQLESYGLQCHADKAKTLNAPHKNQKYLM